jgi:hypothetical protein
VQLIVDIGHDFLEFGDVYGSTNTRHRIFTLGSPFTFSAAVRLTYLVVDFLLSCTSTSGGSNQMGLHNSQITQLRNLAHAFASLTISEKSAIVENSFNNVCKSARRFARSF